MTEKLDKAMCASSEKEPTLELAHAHERGFIEGYRQGLRAKIENEENDLLCEIELATREHNKSLFGTVAASPERMRKIAMTNLYLRKLKGSK